MLLIILAILIILSVTMILKEKAITTFTTIGVASAAITLFLVIPIGLTALLGEYKITEKAYLKNVTTTDGATYWGTRTGDRGVNYITEKQEGTQTWAELRTTVGETKIVEGNYDKPYYTIEEKWDRTFLILPWPQQDLESSHQITTFYVPKNSIVENYNIK